MTTSAAALWVPAVVASMLYPVTVGWFVDSIHAAESSAGAARVLFSFFALLTLAAALAAPALALRGLFVLRLSQSASVLAPRRLLYLVCALPPIYVLSLRIPGVMHTPAGTIATGLVVWWCVWALLGFWTWLSSRRPPDARASSDNVARAAAVAVGGPRTLSGRLGARARGVHRVVVLAVLAGFLLLHLTNHLLAVWSLSAQQAAMHALRLWYRGVWIEPIILALFAAAVLTGVVRLARLASARADGFRVLQTASGGYIVFFLASHIWAALGARYHGIDPNWGFATGYQGGMLASTGIAAVLIYYTGALLAVSVHAGLGVRMVMLARRARAAAADRAARVVIACGGVLSALIVAALLGVRLGG